MTRNIVAFLTAAVLTTCWKVPHFEDPHTLLDVHLKEEQQSSFWTSLSELAVEHELEKAEGDFPEARHHIRAMRLSAEHFAVSINNPHQVDSFIFASSTTGR